MANVGAARSPRKEAAWRRHVKAQAGGGWSVRAYCAAHGLREYSFYWWRRELARRDAARSPAFVPVTLLAQTPPTGDRDGCIEIVLTGDRGGRRVRVTGPVNRQLLSDVLSVLEGPGERAGDVRC